MGLFTGGGLSLIDTPISILLFSFSACSIILNTFVIRYNIRKKLSPPRFLFLSLAINDMLTAFIIPIYVGVKVLEVERPPADVDDVKSRSFSATTINRVHGSIAWTLIYTPCYITGTMTIVRYVQIINPFLKIRIRRILQFLIPLFCYQTVFSTAQAVDSKHDAVWLWEVKLLFNQNTFGLPEFASFMLIASFAVIIVTISMILSVLTIRIIFKSTNVALPKNENESRNRKVSMKILLMNLGNIVFMIPNACGPFLSKYRHVPNVALWFYILPGFFIVSFLPSFLSALNPLIFTLMTPDVFQYRRRKIDIATLFNRGPCEVVPKHTIVSK